ncbi:hypothetical protein [Streptomyces sp. NPDC004629]|uniref:hypothetical protein n=1 Tax=Streptomyces sp. NPDC004629 TaxID=3364705 RepID=UPI00369D8EDA
MPALFSPLRMGRFQLHTLHPVGPTLRQKCRTERPPTPTRATTSADHPPERLRSFASGRHSFTAKNGDAPEGLRIASERLFAAFGDLIGRGTEAGELAPQDPYRRTLLFAATMQGVAVRIGTRRISAEDGDRLIHDAICLLVRGRQDE